MLDRQGDMIIRNESDFKEYLAKRKNKKLYNIKKGRVVVDHVATANVLSKFIELCPMDRWIKTVMLMRVGSPLMKQKAMSHMQIALMIGTTEDEVKEMEVIGKTLVGNFLEKCSVRDVVKKFDSKEENKKGINEVKNIITKVNPETAA